MNAADPSLDKDRLPPVVPVFPLPGVVLLPGGQLPLNVFEPRYLNLVEDALGQGRLMAMVQPRQDLADPVPDDAALYPVGCLGRIVAFVETGSGFLITLQGLNRFRVGGEAEGRNGYRRLRTDYGPFPADLTEDGGRLANRERLLAAMNAYFLAQDIDADAAALEKTSDSQLVTSLAMVCPFGGREKQALLECADLRERGELLTNLMEMASLDGAEGGARH